MAQLSNLAGAILLQGLKQRLLTYLFRQALQQCRPAADAGAGNAAAGAQPDPGGGDGSQPGAAGGAGQGWAAPPGSGAPQQQQRLADRRPLDRFFYNFEPFQELVMWKVTAPAVHAVPAMLALPVAAALPAVANAALTERLYLCQCAGLTCWCTSIAAQQNEN